MDLFQHHRQQLNEAEAPLAARMRPRSLDEFVGQQGIIGPGRLLRRAIQADQLSSLIFYGPPGTGKTTLARIIANTTQAHFIAINAVLAGVKDIRASVETAQELRGLYGQKTILFVDEVHRFNKSQQDALLPWVENGTVILIGATTENPYFEVNKALVSRSRIFQLKPLEPDDLKQVIGQTLDDSARGYGLTPIQLAEDALEHLVNVANGDARTLLNALELAVETTPPDDQGKIQIDLAIAEASIQKRAVLYDKEGDAHFDTISAFIKSLRGSDPDAAMYWLARMIYAGEDPRFIFRRMLILASEDVGLADPQAVSIVNGCAAAFDRVGLPEGQYPLAQAALYLATAPKSNSVLGYFDALKAVEQERESEVPNHLKDNNRDQKELGHGAGYKYPHAYRDHWVTQQYLPVPLQGQMFFQPSDQGEEAKIRDRITQTREAQMAAMMEADTLTVPEGLSYSPSQPNQERWLQRTVSQSGTQLAELRSRIFELAQLQRHHVILDLQGSGGLLVWEALRQTPEGGVYVRVPSEAGVQTLNKQAQMLSQLRQPIVFSSRVTEVYAALSQLEPDLCFDRILGRNLFSSSVEPDVTVDAIAPLLSSLLAPNGKVILAEMIPKASQRIYQLLPQDQVSPTLYQAWQEVEESFYLSSSSTGKERLSDRHLSWDVTELTRCFEASGLKVQTIEMTYQNQWYVSAQVLERWFGTGKEAPSYGDRLREELSQRQVDQIQALMKSKLLNQTIHWRSQVVLATIQIKS